MLLELQLLVLLAVFVVIKNYRSGLCILVDEYLQILRFSSSALLRKFKGWQELAQRMYPTDLQIKELEVVTLFLLRLAVFQHNIFRRGRLE